MSAGLIDHWEQLLRENAERAASLQPEDEHVALFLAGWNRRLRSAIMAVQGN